jgi:hypothetical protein
MLDHEYIPIGPLMPLRLLPEQAGERRAGNPR